MRPRSAFILSTNIVAVSLIRFILKLLTTIMGSECLAANKSINFENLSFHVSNLVKGVCKHSYYDWLVD